jgi:hypothetical protein
LSCEEKKDYDVKGTVYKYDEKEI